MASYHEGAGAVAAALASRIEPLCLTLLPGGRRVGAEWTCGDLSGGAGQSLKVSLRGEKSGLWSYFAEGIGGAALDLVAAIRGRGRAEALRWAREWLGRAPTLTATRSPSQASTRDSASADRRLGAARRLWDEAKPIGGSPAETYLARRGLALAARPADLRFARACRHPTGAEWPAMVAAVRDATGCLVGIHRTYLTEDGSGHAPIAPARAALGPIRGGGVQLGALSKEVVVAEGIESALAASLVMDGAPARAALGAAGLRGLILPALPLAAHVLIFADGDRAGVQAARAAAQRWGAEGRHVWTLRAPRTCDANDVVRLPEYRARGMGDAVPDAVLNPSG